MWPENIREDMQLRSKPSHDIAIKCCFTLGRVGNQWFRGITFLFCIAALWNVTRDAYRLQYMTKEIQLIDLTADGTSSPVRRNKQQYNVPLALFMTFPNSGTSYTSHLVRTVTGQFTASNYGRESIELGDQVPVYNDSAIGPFWTYHMEDGTFPRHLRPTKGYILTKTHCGGSCNLCVPEKYVINSTEQFMKHCLTTNIGHMSGNGVVQATSAGPYRKDLIRRIIHLIRNPFDNIVSRFHDLRNAYKPFAEKYPNTRDGFRAFCKMQSEKFYNEERNSNAFSLVFHFANDIPCYADFYKWIQWHNLAFDLTAELGLPIMLFHYEDYSTQFNATKNKLLEFLEQDEANTTSPFKSGKTYPDYFTADEISGVRKMVFLLATNVTWDSTKHYFHFLRAPATEIEPVQSRQFAIDSGPSGLSEDPCQSASFVKQFSQALSSDEVISLPGTHVVPFIIRKCNLFCRRSHKHQILQAKGALGVRSRAFIEMVSSVLDSLRHRKFLTCSISGGSELITYGRGLPILLFAGDHSGCGITKRLDPFNFPRLSWSIPSPRKYGAEWCNTIPMPSFISWNKLSRNSWNETFASQSSKYQWSSKINKAVWRGSTTYNLVYRGATLNATPRGQLVQKSIENPDLIDAAFTRLAQQYASREEELSNHTILTKYMEFSDQMNYKAITDIDGNSWSGRFPKLLCTNSIVIKVRYILYCIAFRFI